MATPTASDSRRIISVAVVFLLTTLVYYSKYLQAKVLHEGATLPIILNFTHLNTFSFIIVLLNYALAKYWIG